MAGKAKATFSQAFFVLPLPILRRPSSDRRLTGGKFPFDRLCLRRLSRPSERLPGCALTAEETGLRWCYADRLRRIVQLAK